MWKEQKKIQELSKAYNTMLERINQYIEERMKNSGRKTKRGNSRIADAD